MFMDKSFLISGISHYKDNCHGILYETELTMEFEPNNKFDKSAIAIKYNNKTIGYVPNNKIKQMCIENINQILRIINIKMIKGNYGIRVIPKCFYDDFLESDIFFF